MSAYTRSLVSNRFMASAELVNRSQPGVALPMATNLAFPGLLHACTSAGVMAWSCWRYMLSGGLTVQGLAVLRAPATEPKECAKVEGVRVGLQKDLDPLLQRVQRDNGLEGQGTAGNRSAPSAVMELNHSPRFGQRQR
eukprot:CAMPEP_0118998660 /NCGR_PEP_ID=MMETSP1173-20130426/63187_1 /TAXON_ID=1034831 /ORGANISM="Rhizochromulina marina cf, Strain CCMP1243" /LENGTH=137 /DNA_ID=CAMNT_0006950159 /DNA_START=1670 /DNA_END=2082 /DNA_ORIENTATION=-